MPISPQELEAWLEWASARLLALPSARIKPQELQVIWPEYCQNPFEILDFRARLALRALAPTAEEIPIMEEILLLPNVLPRSPYFDLMKRVVRLRCLIHPVSNRHIHKWPQIAKRLEIKQYTAQRLYEDGLERVVNLAPGEKVCAIASFMAPLTDAAQTLHI